MPNEITVTVTPTLPTWLLVMLFYCAGVTCIAMLLIAATYIGRLRWMLQARREHKRLNGQRPGITTLQPPHRP